MACLACAQQPWVGIGWVIWMMAKVLYVWNREKKKVKEKTSGKEETKKRKERMVPVPFPACLSLSLSLVDSIPVERTCVFLSLSALIFSSSYLIMMTASFPRSGFSSYSCWIRPGFIYLRCLWRKWWRTVDERTQPVECQVNSNLIQSLVCLFNQNTLLYTYVGLYMVDVTPNNKPLVLFCTALTTWRPSGWLGLRADLTGYIFLFRMTPIWVYTCGLYIVSASHYMCCSRKDQIPQSVIHFPGRVVYIFAYLHIFTI